MKKLTIFLTLTIAITMISTVLKKNKSQDSKIKLEQFTLDNGLDVVIIPNKKVPAIMHMLWYKVGAINEVEGKTGLAHYLEHLMFHGTEKFPKDEIDNRVSALGGSHNAFTSYDFTAYYQNIPKEYLEEVMDMESDRMRNLVLEEKQTLIERDVVLEERLMRRDNSPKSVLQEKVREALYSKNHPYGRPIIGYEEDINGFSHQDALDFYNKYYFANNAILVLAGDISKEEALPLINKYYAGLENGNGVEVAYAEPVDKVTDKEILHIDKNVSNPILTLSYLAPDMLTKNIKDEPYALTILSYLLSGSKNSILHNLLVVKEGLAVSVSSSYSDMSRGQTDFAISVTLKNTEDEGKVMELVEQELEKIRLGKINLIDLENAKNLFIVEDIYSKESYKSLAYMIGMNYTTGISLEEILSWEDKIADVSIGDIKKISKKVFVEENFVVGRIRKEE